MNNNFRSKLLAINNAKKSKRKVLRKVLIKNRSKKGNKNLNTVKSSESSTISTKRLNNENSSERKEVLKSNGRESNNPTPSIIKERSSKSIPESFKHSDIPSTNSTFKPGGNSEKNKVNQKIHVEKDTITVPQNENMNNEA